MKLSSIMYGIKQYDQILTRYARIIIKDRLLADCIVLRVYESLHSKKVNVPPEKLRAHLHAETLKRCLKIVNEINETYQPVKPV